MRSNSRCYLSSSSRSFKWCSLQEVGYSKKEKKIENGDKKTIKIKYYAQKNYNYVTDFNRVFDKISKKTSFLREQSVKYGKSYIIRIKDLIK